MSNIKIVSVGQTAENGLFTICYESKDVSEFEDFVMRFKNDATCAEDLQTILVALQRMLQMGGFLERHFRPEGKMRDRVCAVPITTNKLRLYCLRLSDRVLIVGNGGRKSTKTYEEDEELNGYVIDLQKLDALLRGEIRKGTVKIEGGTIEGIENKEFGL